MTFKIFSLTVTTAACLLCFAEKATAQTISLTTLGTPYTQNFDALSSTATTTNNVLAINGWSLTETGGGVRDNEQYAVDNGGSSTGDAYSYGVAGNSDRAFGGLQSGTLIPLIGAAFTNTTGATITTLSFSYMGEQWRIGNTAAARDDRLNFEYSTSASDLATGTYTAVAAGNIISPIKTAASASALNGNLAANQIAVSFTITGLSIADGATFWIRWTDLNASGADDGLSIDDFTLTPYGSAPAPEIDVQGNLVSIVDGATTATLTNHSDFGSQSVCAGSLSRTFTILNTGNLDLNLTNTTPVMLSGANAGDFTVTSQPSATTIIAGGSSTFVVEFNPSAAGTATAFISIGNDDANEHPFDFVIQGTGVEVTATLNSLTNVSCNGGNDGAVSVNATGSGTLTYDWEPGALTGDGTSGISGLTAGNYSLTVTDANTCSTTATFSISEPQILVLNVTSTNSLVCAGSSATLSASASGGTGVATYTWSTGENVANIVVTPTLSGTYTVDVTDANNCLQTNTISINVSDLPVISVNSGTICSGESFTITATGADTYTYSGGSNVVSPTSPTSYSVTGTNMDGCVSSAAAVSNVMVNALPVISVNSGTICAGESFTITATGADTYTYSGGSSVVSPTVPTSYSVTGSSPEGCISSAAAVSNVMVNALPVISVNSGTICAGESFTITATGADTYTYSGGSSVVSPTVPTSYSVTGTSPEGCISSAAAVSDVMVNTLPVVNVTASNTLICTGETATLTATGADTYTWSTAATTSIIMVSPTSDESYTVTGTDMSGCNNNAMVSLTVSLCTGISSSNVGASLNVYPNPSNGHFSIELDANAEVEVYDLMGCVILKQQFETGRHFINLDSQANGIYVMKASMAGKNYSIKLLKQ
ncbi:MAG: hypothetical protein K0S53_1124 [Bacteroidetes bacterium]|nr:hypothetical protein [Bacteroidota bacterium]